MADGPPPAGAPAGPAVAGVRAPGSGGPGAAPMRVTGGRGGTYAEFADITTLARLTEEVGAALAAVSRKCHDVMLDGDVFASAVLNPDGVRRFQTALLGALDGRGGLAWLAAELSAHGPLLRTVADSYRAVDRGSAQLLDSIRWAAGYGVGFALPWLAGGGAAALLAAVPVVAAAAPVLVPGAAGGYAIGEALGVDWQRVGANASLAAQRLLSEHLGIVDDVVGSAPGVISGIGGPLGPNVYDVPSGARLLGTLYPDLTPRVEDIGVDSAMSTPPAGFGDVLGGLARRNALAMGEDQGQIDVRVVTHADGSRAYIVDIPGTKDFHATPLEQHQRLNDMGTNLHALGGETTSYQQGMAEALRRAGYEPGAPVMLVGHSQGGMVAAQAASDQAFRDEFRVTHVVTAGAPVARYPIPDSVQMLSLENRYDPVPHLDAASNPDRPNRVTVGFDDQQIRIPPPADHPNQSILDNHGMGQVYAPAGERIDRSDDPSIKAYRESASGFFARPGTTVESKVYEITRQTVPEPPPPVGVR